MILFTHAASDHSVKGFFINYLHTLGSRRLDFLRRRLLVGHQKMSARFGNTLGNLPTSCSNFCFFCSSSFAGRESASKAKDETGEHVFPQDKRRVQGKPGNGKGFFVLFSLLLCCRLAWLESILILKKNSQSSSTPLTSTPHRPMSSSTEYHTFIPDPNGTCLICEKGEYEKEHLRTYAAARRDSIASKNISGGYRLETKSEHPEGEDKDPNASSDNGGAASATAADSSGGNSSSSSSSSSSGKTRNDADEGDDDGNDRRNVADDAEDEIELIDDDNSIYSWGESSRLGPCKNEYYRDNKEH
jgi:hypothetical protein